MKKLLLFFAIAVCSLVLVIPNQAAAGTVPHTNWGYLFNADGTKPGEGAITITAYITARPGEILPMSTTGSKWDAVNGAWVCEVGNFPTNWSAGEILHVDFVNTVNGQIGSLEQTLTSGGGEQAPDFYLAPPPAPEMDLTGKSSTPISSGDTSPSTTDGTDFGSSNVGTPVSQTFTITNSGTANLTLSGSPLVAISGTNATDFTVTATPSSPVAAAGTTTFTIQFSPSATGLRTASVSIANNDGNENPYTFSIQGTGVSPEMDLTGKSSTPIASGDASPSTTDGTDFGSTGVGTPVTQTFTITNSGTANLALSGSPRVAISGTNAADFTVTATPSSPVTAGGTTTFTIQFSPSATGVRTASVSIANNDANENPYTFSIQGTGVAPEMDLTGKSSTPISSGDTSPSTTDGTDFGNTNIGTPVTQTFTITNSGTAALALTGSPLVVISGTNAADFTVTATPTSPVAAGATTTFTIQFSPSAAGLRTASVSIASNDANENPYTFSIQGTGVTTAPEMDLTGKASTPIASGDTSPSTTDGTNFGSTNLGTPLTQTFTITNSGTANLTLSGSPLVAISGTNAGDFTVTANPTSPVAAGGTTTFTIQFSPTAAGARTASVSIANNDGNENPYTFSIQGTGLAPEMDLTGKSSTPIASGDTSPSTTDGTDFGNSGIGVPLTQTFTITNSGTANLTLSGSPLVAISGTHAADFSVTATPSSPVAASGTTTFTIQFSPSAAGARTASISIANNDGNENPYTFSIQGTGIVLAPEIALTGKSSTPISSGDTSPSTTDGTDFGSTNVGTPVTQTFTIANSGTAALNLTGSPLVAMSGTHAGDFTVTATPTSPVTAGGTTTFTIQFSPSAAGLRSASVSIANNDADENPYTFSIQGTGVIPAPEIDVRGNSVSIANGDITPATSDYTDYGNVNISGGTLDHAFTIANTGTAALNLTGSPLVAISGTNAADFVVTAAPTSPVAAGGTTTFTIRFTPSAEGLRTATVTIANSDADENPYTFSIQGTGSTTMPEINITGNGVPIPSGDTTPGLADGTNFGVVVVGAGQVSHSFVITNSGTASLSLTGTPRVVISGANAADFVVVLVPTTPIAINANTILGISFVPTAAGVRTATVSIANNDVDENPYTFAIQGTGTPPAPPEIEVTGSGSVIENGDSTPSLDDATDFGSLVLGATADHVFVINNLGGSNLVLSGTPIVSLAGPNPGDFSVTVNPTTPVAGGASSSLTIRFKPTALGLRLATVNIANNDGDENPYAFTIQGIGKASVVANSALVIFIIDDINGNGIWDTTDPGIFGVEVMVKGLTIDGYDGSKLVGFRGETSFKNIVAQEYMVRLTEATLPSGLYCINGELMRTVEVLANDNTSVIFMFSKNKPADQTPSNEQGKIKDNPKPTEYHLAQNYPNPFNPVTAINFDLVESVFVNLQVFDASGRVVATLVNGIRDAGRHSVTFNAGSLPSGVYYYKITAGSFTATKSMTLVK